ncbi:serine hydrolase domain-containing protein [Ktedonobacter robiniae]|nr:serine hydrolase domain-containing protein [Ktedonobacter robiniae]
MMNESSYGQRGGLSQGRLERLSRVLEGYVERGEFAGVTAMLHRHGELAYAATTGWQDQEAQIPMQRDTIFRLASMTKPIIAAAALTLVEEGKLRLSDPVDVWLPELAQRMVMRDPHGSPNDVYPSPRAITLHDLLTYRLGLGWGKTSLGSSLFTLTAAPIAQALQIPNAERLAPDAWLARIGEFPLAYEPGMRWLYHIASDILGILIARVTRKPLEMALRERIFEPLGMVDTSFVVPAEKRSRLAVLYGPAPEGGLAVLDHPQTTGWAEPPLFASGGAGLVSTADDYLRFGRMLLGKGVLDGVRVLSRKTVEAMTTDYLTPEQHTHATFAMSTTEMWANRGFGYGVQVVTKQTDLGPSVGTFGWPGGLGTAWYVDPREDLVALILLQYQNAIVAADWRSMIGDDFLTLTYQAIND